MVERFICDVTYEVTHKGENGSSWTEHVKCTSKAKDAHDDIEVEKIIGCCNSIAEEVTPLKRLNTNLISFSNDYISKSDLCIEGTGIENIRDDCDSECTVKAQSITDTTDAIKEEAQQVFDDLQTKYNSIAKAKCNHD